MIEITHGLTRPLVGYFYHLRILNANLTIFP